MKTNIALVGFMGTGKTAVGQLLARKLNRRVVETDSIIEQKAGKSIADIFRDNGEITFRELEIEAVKDVAKGRRKVIACGGGVVLNTINIDRLRKSSVIVNLTASPEAILKRISAKQGTRPLLNVDNPAKRTKELMKFRRPFYESSADITIDTSKLDINAIANEIIDRLKSHEGFDFEK
ncbi:MAG: shikimate kinase [Dehalococcoidales bacterium]|nr:shikimate kinase [Dehalococcoidales bacterium]